MNRMRHTTGQLIGSGNGAIRAAVAAMLSVAAGGCVNNLNNEVAIGQAWVPPTLHVHEQSIAPVTQASTEAVEPSTTSLDRSTWPATKVLVPNDLFVHQPRYTNVKDNKPLPGIERRTTGRYPTAESSLEVPGLADVNLQARQGLLAPFGAGLDVLLSPIRAVRERPWQRTRTGFIPYERQPRVQTVMNEPAENMEAPEPPPPMPVEPLYGEEPAPAPALKPLPITSPPPKAPPGGPSPKP